jgi:hypothetical protein
MNLSSTSLTPGRYLYSYPTFADVPQLIDVHFLTPDGQQAFVSYPNHPNHRAAQLIPVSWFGSVTLQQLEGQAMLMSFIETFLTGWSIAGINQRQTSSSKRVTSHHQRYYQQVAA